MPLGQEVMTDYSTAGLSLKKHPVSLVRETLAQQKILTAVKQGTPPDAALVALAGARSRHNTYMSVPLVWMMINSHTSVPFSNSPVYLFVMILLGWGGVYWLYGKAGTVKGF